MLPGGTVTFLFTDIVGSTGRWERDPEGMWAALDEHNRIVSSAVETHGGVVFKTVGDAFCVAFGGPESAVSAAEAIHEGLRRANRDLAVRIGIHTGSIHPTGDDYFGPPVNKAARVQGVAKGGQTLLSDATKGLLPSRIATRDLGVHALRDLLEPTRIWQIGDEEFGPVASLGSVPNNLPLQATSFVARESELAQLVDLLARGRLVTLTGAGGTGKSRLALQLAANRLDRFPEGVWFGDLSPLSDRDDVVAEIAQATRAPGADVDGLVRHLGEGRILLILDNCEHVLDAASGLAEALLTRTAGVSILTTSREPLGARGETVFRVPSLSIPKGAARLEDLSRFGATALFLDRLATASSDSVVADGQAETVARICERLDGIPLAIELAAARGRSMTLGEIERRLDDRFRLLTGGNRNALSRQQTLRALIDWSARLLTERQLNLFVALAVFVDGWDVEAAERICADEARGIDEWDVLDLLSDLVDKSLVAFDPAKGRYRLLESMRHYALEQLDTKEWAFDLRDRHAFHFLEAVDAYIDPSPDARPDRFRRFVENRENFLAGLDWLAGNDAHLPLLLEKLSSMHLVFDRLSAMDRLLDLLDGLLSRAENRIDEVLRERAELSLLHGLVVNRDSRADETLARHLARFESLSAERKDAERPILGYCLFFQNRLDESLALLRDDPGSNNALSPHTVANSLYCQGRYDEAAAWFERSDALLTSQGIYSYAIVSQGEVAVCDVAAGRLREAVEHALEVNRRRLRQGLAAWPYTSVLYPFVELALRIQETWFAALWHAAAETTRARHRYMRDPFDLAFERAWNGSIHAAVSPGELADARRAMQGIDPYAHPWFLAMAEANIDDFFGEPAAIPYLDLLPARPLLADARPS